MTSAGKGTLALAIIATAALSATAVTQAATIANGSYTAAPGEQNSLAISYDAGTDSYTFVGSPMTDGDGVGGCSVALSSNEATCPASAVSAISVDLSDGMDSAQLSNSERGSTRFPPCTVSSVSLGASIEGGTGNDTITGSAGNDTLSGGPGNDFIRAFAGDDVAQGGDGDDLIAGDDGADRLQGGSGIDLLQGLELGPCPPLRLLPDNFPLQIADMIGCGTGGGDDASTPPFEGAFVTQSDEVNIDCEHLEQYVSCPDGGPPCSGELTVESQVQSGNSSAATSARKKKRKTRNVTLGRARYHLDPGGLSNVSVSLEQQKLGLVLQSRQRAPAQFVVRQSKKRKKRAGKSATRLKGKQGKHRQLSVVERIPFVLTKG